MQIKFQYASATGHLTMIDDNHAFVNSIQAAEKHRRHGTRLMENIVAYADARGIVLYLAVGPYGTGRILSSEELVQWYGQFGFLLDANSPLSYGAEMTRLPSRVLQRP